MQAPPTAYQAASNRKTRSGKPIHDSLNKKERGDPLSLVKLTIDCLYYTTVILEMQGDFSKNAELFRKFFFSYRKTVTKSPDFAFPSVSTLTKIPSRGMTQSPAALRMAQSLWHSLPICVTSHRAVPIFIRVPTGSS